jgi:hypothetical protein
MITRCPWSDVRTIKRYIVVRLTPSCRAAVSTSAIVRLLSPCRFSKPQIASSHRQPSFLRRRARPSSEKSSLPTVGAPRGQYVRCRQMLSLPCTRPADIDVALGDDAVERRDDQGVIPVLTELREQVLLGCDVRLRCGDRCLVHAFTVGRRPYLAATSPSLH